MMRFRTNMASGSNNKIMTKKEKTKTTDKTQLNKS